MEGLVGVLMRDTLTEVSLTDAECSVLGAVFCIGQVVITKNLSTKVPELVDAFKYIKENPKILEVAASKIHGRMTVNKTTKWC